MYTRPLSRASTDSTVTNRGGFSGGLGTSSNSIKVVARFRPESETEKSIEGASSIYSFLNDETCQIDTTDFNGTFTFDRVFDSSCNQSEVFEFSLRQTVDDLFKGYNGTVLAYGQTGSGKSYTMMGPSLEDDELRGAIPRIVDLIFEMIEQSPNEIEYIVRVSYMEIYMEKIKDLLTPDNDNLPIHEDKNRGVYVKGLTEEYVSSSREVYDVMKQGLKVRSVGSTNMNSESSRSHSIFGIVVSQKNVSTGSQKSGQLFLVDLAGSEKVVKTGASGQTLEEAKKINKSLSALGNVINALTDGKSTHIPYRDSKLTRILQESLGGNSRTSLIVNCSPSSYNGQETISTLRFGVRAKTIKNKAKINAELSPVEMKAILRNIQSQLDQRISYEQKLEQEICIWRGGTAPPKSEWTEFLPLATNSSLSSNFNSYSGTPTLSRSLSRSENGGAKTPGLKKLRNSALITPGSPGWMSPQKELNVDSIEEFMQRENEYQDSLAQKDSLIDSLQKEIETKSTLAVNMERLEYEKKESLIQVGSLQTEVEQLHSELRTVKQEAIDLRVENEGLKSELQHVMSSRSRLSLAKETRDSSIDYNIPPDLKTILSRQDAKFWETASTYKSLEDDEQLKSFYEENLELKNDTIVSLTQEVERLQISKSPERGEGTLANVSTAQIQSMQERISEFESMKQALMKDLQNRCERIVELEISLDEVRQQYSMAAENNNNRQQQRKVAILQRNLEQLTNVQQQVLAQNQALKKEVAVSQKLLESRNQRIKELETSLESSRMMLTREQDSYETRLGYLKERMNEMRHSRGSVNMGLKIVKPLRGGQVTGSENIN